MMSIFFNDTATTQIYTLSLHDALPISMCSGPLVPQQESEARGRYNGRLWTYRLQRRGPTQGRRARAASRRGRLADGVRSEEHTSELQSQSNLVCRLLLEKKKKVYREHV